MSIQAGSIVSPVTIAGLCLGDVPCDGTYKRKVNTACVLRGKGIVLSTHVIIIDYDSWGGNYLGIGKVEYMNCFVQCDEGCGWAGEGALVENK